MENKYILTSNKELYHYGIPGMRWGVRKNSYNKTVHRSIKKLNRANNKMEKHHVVKTELNRRVELGKKSKNPFVKIYGTSFVLDKKFASARYDRSKRKVDSILNNFEQQGINLKTLSKRKNSLYIGGTYDYISSWNGVRYELD